MIVCCWPMYNVTWYLYTYYDIESTRLYNWKYTWNQTGNNSIKSSNTQAWPHQLLIFMFLRKSLFLLLRMQIMCGMYIIKWVHGPEPRPSGGSTSSNTRASALIPQAAFNGMDRMYQRHGCNQNYHPPVLVRKTLCNQFIHYHISCRGVFVLIISNSVIANIGQQGDRELLCLT